MLVESFFHLDCRPVIPECGFSCDRCVDEIQSVLTGMGGVLSVSREKRRAIDGILVQHESDAVVGDGVVFFERLALAWKEQARPRAADAEHRHHDEDQATFQSAEHSRPHGCPPGHIWNKGVLLHVM